MLDDRKRRILQAVTNDYIETAEPVGSRTIARRYHLGVSPATIRNEMADLEESGYLEQPHTSAGRVPSDKGYRFYVDALMPPHHLTGDERRALAWELEAQRRMVQEVVHHTARLLSMWTRYTAVVVAPRVSTSRFRHIDLIPLDARNVLVVLIADPGFVLNRVVRLPNRIDAQLLGRAAEEMNRSLRGVSLRNIGRTMIGQLRDGLAELGLFEDALGLITQALADGSEQVYLEGTVHIFEQPEFHDVERAKGLLALLEERNLVFSMLSELADGATHVRIGQENPLQEMAGCSLVVAGYRIGGEIVGALGVIGPTRMAYARVLCLVEATAESLGSTLTALARQSPA
ncbi:MAG TPA: heat-inducible transcriptional repressor HrcA [Limnochordia bacterium]|nr:heat-inducible transcriptional repressor HrcA [Limnochordia bacterium]